MSLLLQLFFSITKTTHNKKYRIGHTTILPFFFWKLPWHPVIRPVGVFSCRWRLARRMRNSWRLRCFSVVGGFSSVVCNGWKGQAKSHEIFVVGEFFNWNFTGDFWVGEFLAGIFGVHFFPIFSRHGSYGGVSRVCWGWEVGDSGTSISRCRQKTRGPGRRLTKNLHPQKRAIQIHV